MSSSVRLTGILQDLASGKIDVADAANRILALRPPELGRRFDDESLYDNPPARASEEAAAEVADASDADEASTGDEASVGAEASAGERVEHSLQIDELAATAGEVLKEAGGFAWIAAKSFGRFAGSVLTGAQHEASQPRDGSTHTVADARQPAHTPAVRTAESLVDDRSAKQTRAGAKAIERVVLRSVGRRVRLIGDPAVATIVVAGPHSLRRQGVTLEVDTEGELGLNLNSFGVLRPPRSVEDLRVLGFGQELVVRVNPAIRVDAEVTGARLTTVDVPFLGKVRVSAGGAALSGVVEVADALIQAGGASLAGPMSQGRSRVRVESGNLSILLTRGANVTVRSQTQLGRVNWPGEPHGNLDELVVGNGTARLEVGVVMGRAVIRVEDSLD